MSRLIDNHGQFSGHPPKTDVHSARAVVLSPEQALQHLKKCQAIAVGHAHAIFPPYLHALNHAFDVMIDQAKSNQEVAELSGIQRLFQKNRDELESYFSGYVAEGFVKFKQKDLCTEINGAEGEELSIVDNVDLEETLVLADLLQKVDAKLAEPLWALNQRMAALNGGEPVREATNPCAPVQFCESLRKAIKLVPMGIAAARTVLESFSVQLTQLAEDVARDTNDYLAKNHILPELRYRDSSPKISKSRTLDNEARALAGNDEDSESYQNSLLNAIRGLQQTLSEMSRTGLGGLGGLGGLVTMGAPTAPIFNQQQLVDALQAVQLQALGMSGIPMNGAYVTPLNLGLAQQQLQQQLGNSGRVSQNDMHAIELVGRIFEYMLRDDNLPDSTKAVLSYLHTPYLKLAFIDPSFFDNPGHPARMLLNNLAEAGIRWVGNDGTIQHNILDKIRHSVERLLNEFENDPEVIIEILVEFDNHAKTIARRQELMEKRATEKAQGEERLREVKQRVNDEIMQRTDGKELPSSVLLFLLQPWFDYLAFCLLRYGNDSEQWRSGMRLVDDLLVAIEHKDKLEAKAQSEALLSSLKSEISAGFETIGYDADKGAKLISSISDVLTAVVKQEPPAPEPLPVQEEVRKIVAEKRVTVQIQTDLPTEEEQRVVDGLKQIEFGTWFEFEGGRRLKVAWYNSRTMHYMLVNQVGKKEAMLTGLELARKMISKQAQIVSGSSKPFFERALEDIYKNLKEPGEQTQIVGEVEHI